MLMVTPVDRHPLQHRPFQGHGAERRQKELNGWKSFKRAMGKVAVETHGDSDCRQHVHAEEQDDLEPGDASPPEEENRGQETEEGQDDRDQVDGSRKPDSAAVSTKTFLSSQDRESE